MAIHRSRGESGFWSATWSPALEAGVIPNSVRSLTSWAWQVLRIARAGFALTVVAVATVRPLSSTSSQALMNRDQVEQ